MATLSVRALRTKDDRFQPAEAPLARWKKNTTQVALRADGSIVVNSGMGWHVAHWPEFGRKGNSVEAVDAHIRKHGFERVDR